MDVEFAHEALAVRLDSAHPEPEETSCLFIAQAFSDRDEDFAFAVADSAQLCIFAFDAFDANDLVQGNVGNVRAEESTACGDDFYGFDELVGGGLFQDVTAGAGSQHEHDQLRVAVHREDQHSDRWILFVEYVGGREAVHARHDNVHEYKIRLVRFGFAYSILSIDRLSNYVHLLSLGQTIAQTLADKGMIIGHQHANGPADNWLLACDYVIRMTGKGRGEELSLVLDWEGPSGL
jgi:hypothetical protein